MRPPIMSSVVMPSRTELRNIDDGNPKSQVETVQPPAIPITSAINVSKGKVTISASSRGATSLRIGSVPSARIASICSETTIDPNSAEIADTARPVTISAVNTGPNSRTSEIETRYPSWSTAPYDSNV